MYEENEYIMAFIKSSISPRKFEDLQQFRIIKNRK